MKKNNSWKWLVAIALLALPIALSTAKKKDYPSWGEWHQTNLIGITEEALASLEENGTVYVNTELPGVKKVYDPIFKEYVWRDGMGNYLCKDKNMAPLEDIDKNVFFNGDKNNIYVHKEYDPKRECFVWKDTNGNFLGRDKPDEQTENNWLTQTDNENWMDSDDFPKGENKTPNLSISEKKGDSMVDITKAAQEWEQKKQEILKKQETQQAKNQQADQKAQQAVEQVNQQAAKQEAELKKTDAQVQDADAQIQQAEAQIKQARAMLRQMGMTEYEGYLDQAEAQLQQGKRATSQYKAKRKK